MFESVKTDDKEVRQFFKYHDNETESKQQQLSPSIALNTQGNQVYVAPEQEKHLKHELGHVVQQKQGIVNPTRKINGITVNDSVKLEQEADAVSSFGFVQLKILHNPYKDVIQRQSDFQKKLCSKGTLEIPKVLVYGIEESRRRQRVLSINDDIKLNIRGKALDKENMLSIIDNFPKLRKESDEAATKKIEVERQLEDMDLKASAVEFEYMMLEEKFTKLKEVFDKALAKKNEAEQQMRDMDTELAKLDQQYYDSPKGYVEKRMSQPVGGATTGLYTVDRYNNYSWRDFNHRYTNFQALFSIFNPGYVSIYGHGNDGGIQADLKGWAYTSDAGEKEKGDINTPGTILHYQDKLLSHSSYSPITTYHESREFVKLKEQREGEGTEAWSKEQVEEAKNKFELQTRRACKFGLEYATEYGLGVAFLKDGGDQSFVTDKKKIESLKRVPITTSEMRKQYALEMSGKNKASFFDKDGKTTSAPWESMPFLWNKIDIENRLFYKALLEVDNIDGLTLSELKSNLLTSLNGVDYEGKSPSEKIWICSLKCCDRLNIANAESKTPREIRKLIVSKSQGKV